ncbi:23S rRNA (guanosine(2251)-2'-O)-methyltransferase RlmB [bacterium AH-315-P07]|nr:23S rRNA (guanosine(2251)-2'-O)-methyltransferase RlmB [bacterium AH-315-P07]
MVLSNKKRKDKKKLAASHNKSWIWGRHAVLEILEAGRWPIHDLHLSDALDVKELNHARDLAEALNTRIRIEPPERLRELARTAEHQGYLAKMMAFPYTPLGDLKNLIQSSSSDTTIAILDRIQDPHNFGAIVRSAEVLGLSAILISSTHQADVTPAVARASAGAVNHIPIVQVEDLAKSVSVLKQQGLNLLAATEDGVSLEESNPFDRTGNQSPIGIVMGNEGEGISQDILDHCKAQIQIPQRGKIESLNVAAAAAILFNEATRK